METVVKENTPVAMLTVGQLADYLNNHQGETPAPDQDAGRKANRAAGPEPGTMQGKYVYGLRGICSRYGVGKNTACNWANGLLAPAVIKEGRKIIVNTEKADLILEEWTKQQQRRQQRAAR